MNKTVSILYMYDCLKNKGYYTTDEIMKNCGITSVLTFHRYNMDLKKYISDFHKGSKLVYVRSKHVYRIIEK